MINKKWLMKDSGAISMRREPSAISIESSWGIQLHPKELSLIIALRAKFRSGEVTVIMRDGVPQYIKRVIEFDHLTNI